MINIGNSEGTWTQEAMMISKFKEFAKEQEERKGESSEEDDD